jgi:uncharacterized membrane protein (DUF373 family)
VSQPHSYLTERCKRALFILSCIYLDEIKNINVEKCIRHGIIYILRKVWLVLGYGNINAIVVSKGKKIGGIALILHRYRV